MKKRMVIIKLSMLVGAEKKIWAIYSKYKKQSIYNSFLALGVGVKEEQIYEGFISQSIYFCDIWIFKQKWVSLDLKQNKICF